MKHTKLTVIISLATISILSCTTANKKNDSHQQQKPNIIYILADDMSYYDISRLGQKHFDTPNLDKLMNEGMFFREAYSGSPECGPSRASILTGMHMGHSRIRKNRSFRGQEYLEAEDITIAEMLKKAGYSTGMFGKWGVGIPGTPGTPDKQGFDYSFGYYDQLRAHGFFPNYLMENDKVYPLPENYGFDMQNSYAHSNSPTSNHTYTSNGKLVPKGVKDPSKATYSQNIIQEKVLNFIGNNKNGSFFLYYPTQLPHGPLIVPDISKFKDRPWDTKHKEWAAMMELLDKHVGEIIQLLEELNIRDNTLILFSSDNGYSQWGYMGRKAHVNDPIFDNKGPWDKGKFIASDGGSRVPFIANWPDVIKPGTQSDEIVALYDIFATACDIAMVEPPKTDGKSLLPILKGEFPKDKKLHDFLYWENGSFNENMQSARFDNWFAYRTKYTDSIKVFDLTKDIACQINIADKNPEIVEKARAIFKNEHTPSKWYSNPDDTKEERALKKEKAKTDFSKVTRPNSRRPQNMEELIQMLDSQKTLVNEYQ